MLKKTESMLCPSMYKRSINAMHVNITEFDKICVNISRIVQSLVTVVFLV